MSANRTADLEAIARSLVAAGKGILAVDESMGTIEKRLTGAGITPTDAKRRAYCELLLTTPKLGEFISGAILFDETLRQKAANGTPLIEALQLQGIIPGIKVDRGATPLAGFPNEKITVGLDGLRARLTEYAELGARFAKWRAVIAISSDLPTHACLVANAQALARYAALAQEAGLVPIVEPEILMDGEHSLERHGEVTEATLHLVFHALREQRVRLEAILLKTNMVLPGTENSTPASVAEVARATLECVRRAVPAAVPGIVFLSGGQSDEQATMHLNELNRAGPAPWQLSFSFGRALQSSALKAWSGKAENIPEAQRALCHRAECNSAARSGTYSGAMEQARMH
ncbi:MAG: class I fructose-bisphosphate aldolase [Verrucomicrobiota bacterium]